MVIHLSIDQSQSCLTSLIWPNIIKNIHLQMITHLSIVHGLGCLTSVIWPFTLTALTFESRLCCANISHFKDGWAVTIGFFFVKLVVLAQIYTMQAWAKGQGGEWSDH